MANLVPINGAKYNTAALQNASFSNIQAKGGTLYGIPKQPLLPNLARFYFTK